MLFLQLELANAKKDAALAAKDERIDSLEQEVSAVKSTAAPVFRAKAADEATTPRILPDREHCAPSSTPNQVSDDSNQVSDESGVVDGSLSLSQSDVGSLSLSQTLSNISPTDSSDNYVEQQATSDGRWNIPFDGSFEEELVAAKSPVKLGHENALKEIKEIGGFIPISREGRLSLGGAVSPVRPVASRASFPSTRAMGRSVLKDDTLKDKENISPLRRSSYSPGIALRDIR